MSDANILGRTLEDFDILSLVARGGLATTYRAFHRKLEHVVALRVLNQEFLTDPSIIKYFFTGARIGFMLEHSHILPIYDAGSVDKWHYIVSKYISGGSLNDRIRSQEKMSLQELVKILDPVADALDYAHRNLVIHCDIKPNNILLDSDGSVYLSDFMLSRKLDEHEITEHEKQGLIVGTPEYMSPERITGSSLTPATDIYSLGVTLYKLLTDKYPLPSDGSAYTILTNALSSDPIPITTYRPDLSPAIEGIVMRCIDKNPLGRYPTSSSVIAAIKEAEGITTTADNEQNKERELSQEEYKRIQQTLVQRLKNLEEEAEHLNKLLVTENRRRRILEQRQAVEGIRTPADIVIELEDLIIHIEERERQINALIQQQEDIQNRLLSIERRLQRNQ